MLAHLALSAGDSCSHILFVDDDRTNYPAPLVHESGSRRGRSKTSEGTVALRELTGAAAEVVGGSQWELRPCVQGGGEATKAGDADGSKADGDVGGGGFCAGGGGGGSGGSGTASPLLPLEVQRVRLVAWPAGEGAGGGQDGGLDDATMRSIGSLFGGGSDAAGAATTTTTNAAGEGGGGLSSGSSNRPNDASGSGSGGGDAASGAPAIRRWWPFLERF